MARAAQGDGVSALAVAGLMWVVAMIAYVLGALLATAGRSDREQESFAAGVAYGRRLQAAEMAAELDAAMEAVGK